MSEIPMVEADPQGIKQRAKEEDKEQCKPGEQENNGGNYLIARFSGMHPFSSLVFFAG
jgi:hypothetical protein